MALTALDKLRKKHEKEIKELQASCPHTRSQWVYLASKYNMFRMSGYEVLRCENCGKHLDKRKELRPIGGVRKRGSQE